MSIANKKQSMGFFAFDLSILELCNTSSIVDKLTLPGTQAQRGGDPELTNGGVSMTFQCALFQLIYLVRSVLSTILPQVSIVQLGFS